MRGWARLLHYRGPDGAERGDRVAGPQGRSRAWRGEGASPPGVTAPGASDAAPGGPAPTQQVLQKRNQASCPCWGPAGGPPCAGDTGKVSRPPTPQPRLRPREGAACPSRLSAPPGSSCRARPPRWDRGGGSSAADRPSGARLGNGGRSPRKGQRKRLEPARWPSEVPPQAGGAGSGSGPHGHGRARPRGEPARPRGVTGPSPARASCASCWCSVPWYRWPSGGSTTPAR